MRTICIILLFLSGLAACKSPETPAPSYDPKACTRYACPLHKDLTSTSADSCPVCKTRMQAITSVTPVPVDSSAQKAH